MAQQIINNGESGLVVRTKLNDNFTELYAAIGGGGQVTTIYVNPVAPVETPTIKQTFAAAHAAALPYVAQGAQVYINLTLAAGFAGVDIPTGTYDMSFMVMGNDYNIDQFNVNAIGGPVTFLNGTYKNMSIDPNQNTFIEASSIAALGGAGYAAFDSCFIIGDDATPPVTVTAPFAFVTFGGSVVWGRAVNANGNGVQAAIDANTVLGNSGSTSIYFADTDQIAAADGTRLLPRNISTASTGIYLWPCTASSGEINVIEGRNVVLDVQGTGYPSPNLWFGGYIETINGINQQMPYVLQNCVIAGNYDNYGGGIQYIDNSEISVGSQVFINNGNPATWFVQNFTLNANTLTGVVDLTINVLAGDPANISTTHAGYSGTLTVVDARSATVQNIAVAIPYTGLTNTLSGKLANIKAGVDLNAGWIAAFTAYTSSSNIQELSASDLSYGLGMKPYSAVQMPVGGDCGIRFVGSGTGSVEYVYGGNVEFDGTGDFQVECAENTNLGSGPNGTQMRLPYTFKGTGVIAHGQATNIVLKGGMQFVGALLSITAPLAGKFEVNAPDNVTIDVWGDLTIPADTFAGTGSVTVIIHSGVVGANISLVQPSLAGGIIFQDLRGT